ncbi:hypothetical protein AB4K20DRAFT_1890185 [Rhizopus microsporus]
MSNSALCFLKLYLLTVVLSRQTSTAIHNRKVTCTLVSFKVYLCFTLILGKTLLYLNRWYGPERKAMSSQQVW